jgi:hypothetical protein
MLQKISPPFAGPWVVSYESNYEQIITEVEKYWTMSPAERAISLQQKGTDYWNQVLSSFTEARFARLCAYLRQREPDDTVGYSILIYRLTDDDVQRALLGAPGELRPDAYRFNP